MPPITRNQTPIYLLSVHAAQFHLHPTKLQAPGVYPFKWRRRLLSYKMCSEWYSPSGRSLVEDVQDNLYEFVEMCTHSQWRHSRWGVHSARVPHHADTTDAVVDGYAAQQMLAALPLPASVYLPADCCMMIMAFSVHFLCTSTYFFRLPHDILLIDTDSFLSLVAMCVLCKLCQIVPGEWG